MTRTRRQIARLAVAVVFVLPVILSSLTDFARGASAREVEAAKDKLASLNTSSNRWPSSTTTRSTRSR